MIKKIKKWTYTTVWCLRLDRAFKTSWVLFLTKIGYLSCFLEWYYYYVFKSLACWWWRSTISSRPSLLKLLAVSERDKTRSGQNYLPFLLVHSNRAFNNFSTSLFVELLVMYSIILSSSTNCQIVWSVFCRGHDPWSSVVRHSTRARSADSPKYTSFSKIGSSNY